MLLDRGLITATGHGFRLSDEVIFSVRLDADLRPDTPWQATVAGQAWWLADLGGHCPDCGYPLAERSWPPLHRRPADGRSCDLELDDDPWGP